MWAKNIERGENRFGNLAGGASRRILAAGDASGEETIAGRSGDTADEPAQRGDTFRGVASGAGLAAQGRLAGLRQRHDVKHRFHGPLGKW